MARHGRAGKATKERKNDGIENNSRIETDCGDAQRQTNAS
jgi:hypothetical protein